MSHRFPYLDIRLQYLLFISRIHVPTKQSPIYPLIDFTQLSPLQHRTASYLMKIFVKSIYCISIVRFSYLPCIGRKGSLIHAISVTDVGATPGKCCEK